ncbi:MAG: hypothetical protein ACOZCL_02125 [Bacillota bacterium]
MPINETEHNLQPCLKSDNEFYEAKEELHSFFEKLYEDMYENPDKYGIPLQSYPDDIKFNEKRLNVVRVVKGSILDFLFKIGQAGKVNENKMLLNSAFFRELCEEKRKKAKSLLFLERFSHFGLNFNEGNEVIVSSTAYPKMLTALVQLASACSKDKKNGLNHFYRCDYRLLSEDATHDINEVARLLPENLKVEVLKTYALLRHLRYRVKIEYYEDFGFRISYSNKSGVVYYCHIHSYRNYNLFHYVRWILDTDQSAKMFTILDSQSPELSNIVLSGLSRCNPDCMPGYGASSPESCIARIKVEYKGNEIFACKDKGWTGIGTSSVDFINLRKALEAMHDVVYV